MCVCAKPDHKELHIPDTKDKEREQELRLHCRRGFGIRISQTEPKEI